MNTKNYKTSLIFWLATILLSYQLQMCFADDGRDIFGTQTLYFFQRLCTDRITQERPNEDRIECHYKDNEEDMGVTVMNELCKHFPTDTVYPYHCQTTVKCPDGMIAVSGSARSTQRTDIRPPRGAKEIWGAVSQFVILPDINGIYCVSYLRGPNAPHVGPKLECSIHCVKKLRRQTTLH